MWNKLDETEFFFLRLLVEKKKKKVSEGTLKNLRSITMCCNGNYITHRYLTCQICSVYNVSSSENLVNKAAIAKQQGSVAAFPVIIQLGIRRSSLWPIPGEQLLGGTARDWAVCSPTAPGPGPNGADWSHFTTGPMQPAEQNRAELVAQGPEAHYKDQSMLCCWQRWEQGGTFTTHKPLSDTEASFKYLLKCWLLGFQTRVSIWEMLHNNSA